MLQNLSSVVEDSGFLGCDTVVVLVVCDIFHLQGRRGL